MSTSLEVSGSVGLHDVAWAHRTRTYQALDYRFEVRTTDPALGSLAERIFRDFPPPPAGTAPDVVYSVLDPAATSDGRHRLFADDEVVITTGQDHKIASLLMWHINQQIIAHATNRVLVHAAGAVKDGIGIMMPAAMEAGKTTLVAGLLRAGFHYLSDESVAIDLDGSHIRGYPKPLSIDRGSWEVLADLAPPADEEGTSYLEHQWQVPAGAVRPDAAYTEPVPARYIVVPGYEAGAGTRLEALSRASTLRLLTEQTFATGVADRVSFATAANLVRRCDCYRLTVGDLDEACALITDVVDQGR